MTPEKGGSLPGGLLFVYYLQRVDLDPKGDFMKNKQIRRIIILIMCLVLVFNLAVSAYAFSAGTVAFATIAAGVAVAGTLQALGITAGNDTSTFSEVVSDAVSYLESVGNFVTNGMIVMLGIRHPDTDTYRSYALNSMVQTLLEWFFDDPESTVNVLPVYNPYYTSYDAGSLSGALSYARNCPKAFRGTYKVFGSFGNFINSYDAVIVCGDSGYSLDNGTLSINGSVTNHSRYLDNSDSSKFGPVSSTGIHKYYDCTEIATSPYYTTESDLTLGMLGNPFVDGIPEYFGALSVYMPWAAQGVAVPLPGTTTDEDWVPVTIGGISIEDVLAGSQADAQAGTVVDGVTWVESEAVPDVTPGTATLSDILSAILSIPQAIVRSITQALSNFFGISGTADAYAISLTDFFPFCIPFDIYEFLSVLSAAPEAPVFHWEIPVPQLGRTFDIDVDLSPWDPVAAVFRTFELLAFIVGLGMITREKFLRS